LALDIDKGPVPAFVVQTLKRYVELAFVFQVDPHGLLLG
jgi:hypothetical protein